MAHPATMGMAECKTSLKDTKILTGAMASLMAIGLVFAAVHRKHPAYRYVSAALAAVALLIGIHTSFSWRCYSTRWASVSDLMSTIALALLIIILVV